MIRRNLKKNLIKFKKIWGILKSLDELKKCQISLDKAQHSKYTTTMEYLLFIIIGIIWGNDLLNLKKFKKNLVYKMICRQICSWTNMAIGCLVASIILFFCGLVSHGIFLAVVSNSMMNLAKLKKT